MKRFIKLAVWALFYIALIIFLTVFAIDYAKMHKTVEQLEINTESLSEWYIELKNANIDLINNIIDLTAEDFNIYIQIIKEKISLNEIISNTIEGFEEINKLLGNMDSKITESKELIKKNKYEVVKFKNLIENNKQELERKQKYPSYEYLKSVTVYIRGSDSTGAWSGTGIIVKSRTFNTYILTNAHIVGKGRENVTLYVEDEYRTRLATIVKIHDKLDLALIKINGTLEGKQVIKGISIRTKPQDKVYLVGHHLGRKYVYGEGVFAGYEGVNDIIQIPVLFGNSGSGVFNKDGKLVSLIFAINRIGFLDVDCAHGLGIDSLNIIHFLKTTGVF